ncbi:MAG: ETC complex I subunit [Maricaulis sp.]|nr:ETC complex I subunit [Maricaulis sp.]
MFAKIYRPARNAMQSGRGKSNMWLLEFTPEMAKTPDPLMGWASSSDMRSQIRLEFDSQADAVAYAGRQGIAYQVIEPQEAKRHEKSYSANFSPDRKQPWSH